MSRMLPALFAALLVPSVLSAQEGGYGALLGEWEMTLETPRGSITQTLVFTATDDELGGTATSPRGENALSNVTFDGSTVTFEIVREFRGNSMVQEFTASVDGDTMTGTISGGGRGGSGRPGGAGPPGGGGPREFTAKRIGN